MGTDQPRVGIELPLQLEIHLIYVIQYGGAEWALLYLYNIHGVGVASLPPSPVYEALSNLIFYKAIL